MTEIDTNRSDVKEVDKQLGIANLQMPKKASDILDIMRTYPDLSVCLKLNDAITKLAGEGRITLDAKITWDSLEEIRQELISQKYDFSPEDILLMQLGKTPERPIEKARSYIEELKRKVGENSKAIEDISSETAKSVTQGISDIEVNEEIPIPPIMHNIPDQTVEVFMPIHLDVSNYATSFGGDMIFEYEASNLPPGLNFDYTTGIISGMPTQPGDWHIINVRARSAGGWSEPVSFKIEVNI